MRTLTKSEKTRLRAPVFEACKTPTGYPESRHPEYGCMYSLDAKGDPVILGRGPKDCACLALHSLESIHADFGFVPEHFHSIAVDQIQVHEDDNAALQDYLKNPMQAWQGHGLYIWADQIGCGKTTLAHLVVRKLYEYAQAEYLFPEPETYGAWYTLGQAFGSIAMGFAPRDAFKKELDFLGEKRKVDLWLVPGPVVIDEFGREGTGKAGEAVRELYENFFRERIGKPTIIVSHLPPDDTRERFGEQLASLMSASMTTVELTGKDKRSAINSQFFYRR